KSIKGILVGFDNNGYKLWDVTEEKFFVARDVVIDERNMINSRAEKYNMDILNESKDENQSHLLNESKESELISLPNESKKTNEINIPNDSKGENQSKLLNDSRKSEQIFFPNESKKSNELEQPSDIITNRSNENPVKTGDNEATRKSIRLQNKPQICYKEDE
ncbi:hypothetical protein KR044_007443, partial [Drosophila immigrans]